jgi:probable phosphoglycerate mutase
VDRVLLLRHAPTHWNRQGRIQGQRDVALAPAGRSLAASRRLPPAWEDARWFASPLVRAVDTARLMGARATVTDPRLKEMDWGEWEGFTLAQLRVREGEAMRCNEARGLDFRPGGGESPREVRDRLAAWLAALGSGPGAAVAVTHKGVIRCALSLADGWDMRAAYPQRLDWGCGQAFALPEPGRIRVLELNVALREHAA